MAFFCKGCKSFIIPDTSGCCPLCKAKPESTVSLRKATQPLRPGRASCECAICGKEAKQVLKINEKIRLDQDTPIEYLKYIFWPIIILLKLLGRNTDYRTFSVSIPLCGACKSKNSQKVRLKHKGLYDL